MGEIMAIMQKQVNYAKEVDDVLNVLVLILKQIKAKADLKEITQDLLPVLIEAISNAQQIPEELKNVKVIQDTIALKLSEMVAIFTE